MIAQNVEKIFKQIPSHVTVVAAVKTRSVEMVNEAYQAGITHFGHNYVQEAASMLPQITFNATWHMIGHLQRNKTKQALQLFDQIDSLDSIRLAAEIEKQAAQLGRTVPVLIEVNSGEEDDKTGIEPENALELAQFISTLAHLKLVGVMTMGPRFGDPESSREYFKKTRVVYEQIEKNSLPQVSLQYLSMGMSNDYLVAIEEGANVVRLGTAIFEEQK